MYFAKSICPHCKKEKEFWLGGLIWGTLTKPFMYGDPITTCDYCGKTYNPQENCIKCERED